MNPFPSIVTAYNSRLIFFLQNFYLSYKYIEEEESDMREISVSFLTYNGNVSQLSKRLYISIIILIINIIITSIINIIIINTIAIIMITIIIIYKNIGSTFDI